MTETITRSDLIGHRLPDGAFTIDPEAHATFCDAVFAGPWTHAEAHPMFLHIVAHVGKGMPLDEFFALIGTRLDAGVTFGEGVLDHHRPLLVGADYRVSTSITGVERKSGRRKGPFDVVTVTSEVSDATGTLVGTSTESYVVPVEVAA